MATHSIGKGKRHVATVVNIEVKSLLGRLAYKRGTSMSKLIGTLVLREINAAVNRGEIDTRNVDDEKIAI